MEEKDRDRRLHVREYGSKRECGESGEWHVIGVMGSEICGGEKWKTGLERSAGARP